MVPSNPLDGARRQPLRIVAVVGVLVIAGFGVVLWLHPAKTQDQVIQSQAAASLTYIGADRCAGCHKQEAEAWRHSHHAQAMQQANAATVLGNFRNGRFAKDGLTSTFYTKEGKHYVRADGPDGKLNDYPVAYTFGVYPLQQYLLAFPNGRLQSLGIAWDSRTKPERGQRWFHLYPDQKMTHADPLHWTGRNQNWNYMCAACHSTNLRENYDLATDSYSTSWSEINVSCESCHGPGSNHVAWAQSPEKKSDTKSESSKGLVVPLKSNHGGWQFEESSSSGTMQWKGQPRTRTELETCAPCHSRRHPIKARPEPGEPFLNAYAPSLLDEGVYFADGQIQEEDYEYGSFVQSKMYHAGVTCSDCHNPHSLALPTKSLNSVCGQCHSLGKFDAAEHHHHKTNSAGALCVNCHMPGRTYMVIDARRDHSFRVPRPDLSITYGTPNACNQCHAGKSTKWAADAVATWYGPGRRREPHFVEALDAGRRGLPEAERLLTSLIADSSKPAIARATALALIPQYLGPASLAAIRTSLADDDALVRAAAVRALEPLPAQGRVQFAASLLNDSIRSVRIEAARLLADSEPELSQAQKVALHSALSERIESEMSSAERPESHMNLGLLYTRMGRPKDAEYELQTALRLDSNYVPAMVNLADLYRVQQRETEAQQLLEKAIGTAPDAAEPIHALGLLKVRLGLQREALDLFAKAASLQPGSTRYAYVYGVALNSYGEKEKAIAVLKKAQERRPADRDVLTALIAFQRDKGDVRAAAAYADRLIQLNPGDVQAIALRNSLNQPQPPLTKH